MPTTSPPLPAMPSHNIPLVDPRTGLLTQLWYDYFRALDQIVRKIRTEIP